MTEAATATTTRPTAVSRVRDTDAVLSTALTMFSMHWNEPQLIVEHVGLCGQSTQMKLRPNPANSLNE